MSADTTAGRDAERRGFFWLSMALAQSCETAFLWWLVFQWAKFQMDYPPEVLIAAHVSTEAPHWMLWAAVLGSLSAFWMWGFAIWNAER